MTRILSSVLVVVTLAGVVASGTLALFSDSASINGVTIASGSADLKIGNGTPQHADNLPGPFPAFNGLFPGFSVTRLTPGNEPLNLYNVSSAPINLKVRAQITSWNSTQGNWQALATATYVRVVNVTDPLNPVEGDYHTLLEWHDSGFDLPGAPLPQADPLVNYSGKGAFQLEILVDVNAGNEIANADLSNMTITFTGTQAV